MSMFHGLSAFPFTPADAAGIVDVEAVGRLTARLAAAGVGSIGLLGSTGGYAYLSRGQRRRAVRAAVAAVAGRAPLIVGVGALRTDDAEALARDAAEEGADGLLLAPVSYTPLTQEEAFQHYVAVAGAAPLPLCIYNNPVTTHFQFSPALLARLAEVPGIAAVKMPLPTGLGIGDELAALRAGPAGRLAIGYSGDWGAAEALLAGADAWYSVIGGTLPAIAATLVRAAQAGDEQETLRLDGRLQPLWALFRAHGGVRVIHAILGQRGLAHAALPRPLLPLEGEALEAVAAAIEGLD